MLDTINMLWVGNALSKMERGCIRSFIRAGHPVRLYTYSPVEYVPEGTIIADGNEITPASNIARFQNLANFSDFFRFTLLEKQGGWWVDTDTYCLKPFVFPQQYVFSSQLCDDRRTEIINTGIIKAPAHSELMRRCIANINAKNVGETWWAELGPCNLIDRTNEMGLAHYGQPARVFCPLPYFEAPENIFAPGTDHTTFSPDTVAVHLWNEEARRKNINKDAEHVLSLYQKLVNELKVLVVVPTHNRREFLDEALLSLANQSRFPNEIVVTGNVMPDETFNVTRRYLRDAPFIERVNQAIGDSNCDAFILLCDDDKIEPDYIEKTAALMERSNADIVYTDFKHFGERSNEERFPNGFVSCDPNPMPITSLCKKSMWQKVGGYKEVPFFDWDFWWSCCEHGASHVHIKETLFNYRIHAGSDGQQQAAPAGALEDIVRRRHVRN